MCCYMYKMVESCNWIESIIIGNFILYIIYYLLSILFSFRLPVCNARYIDIYVLFISCLFGVYPICPRVTRASGQMGYTSK